MTLYVAFNGQVSPAKYTMVHDTYNRCSYSEKHL